ILSITVSLDAWSGNIVFGFELLIFLGFPVVRRLVGGGGM
ncbi:hypothetical protein HRED_11262, partial [Candidatus Haloredivivus sp. G17]